MKTSSTATPGLVSVLLCVVPSFEIYPIFLGQYTQLEYFQQFSLMAGDFLWCVPTPDLKNVGKYISNTAASCIHGKYIILSDLASFIHLFHIELLQDCMCIIFACSLCIPQCILKRNNIIYL